VEIIIDRKHIVPVIASFESREIRL